MTRKMLHLELDSLYQMYCAGHSDEHCVKAPPLWPPKSVYASIGVCLQICAVRCQYHRRSIHAISFDHDPSHKIIQNINTTIISAFKTIIYI